MFSSCELNFRDNVWSCCQFFRFFSFLNWCFLNLNFIIVLSDNIQFRWIQSILLCSFSFSLSTLLLRRLNRFQALHMKTILHFWIWYWIKSNDFVIIHIWNRFTDWIIVEMRMLWNFLNLNFALKRLDLKWFNIFILLSSSCSKHVWNTLPLKIHILRIDRSTQFLNCCVIYFHIW